MNQVFICKYCANEQLNYFECVQNRLQVLCIPPREGGFQIVMLLTELFHRYSSFTLMSFTLHQITVTTIQSTCSYSVSTFPPWCKFVPFPTSITQHNTDSRPEQPRRLARMQRNKTEQNNKKCMCRLQIKQHTNKHGLHEKDSNNCFKLPVQQASNLFH